MHTVDVIVNHICVIIIIIFLHTFDLNFFY